MAEEEIGARLKLKDRKQFSDDADKAAKSVKDIGDETAKADTKMRTMGGSGGGSSILSKGISGLMSVAKLGALAIAGVGIAAGIAGVKFISLAMDAGETASAFATVFGPATKEVQGFVDTLNQDYGIPTAELQDAARQFGVFAKAAGVPQDGLADFSTSLTQAGLDMSSFYNAAPDEVFTALQGGLAGETEGLRRFGIFMSDASLNAFALTKGIKKTTQEMTDQEKVALRQQFIMANLGDAQGDLERTSGGLANQWRGLKGRMTEAGTAIGTAFLPYATTLVNTLNGKMGPAVERISEKLPLLIDSFVQAFRGEGITTEWKNIYGMAERLGVGAMKLKNLWDKLYGAFQEGGFDGVVAKLDELMGVGDLLTSTVAALKSIWDSLGRIWKGMIVPVLKQFNDLIPKGTRPVELLATGLKWVADNGKTLQPVLAALLAGLIAFKVVSGIIKGITAAQAALNTVMAMNPIGVVVIAIAALAAGLIYAWNNSEKFREVVTGAFNAVKGVAVGVWDWFNVNWPLLLAILTGPIGLAVLAIIENWDSIKTKVTEVKDWIVEKWDEVVGFFTGLPERFTTATTGMFDGIKEAFRAAINWIIDAWNGFSIGIPAIDTHIPGVGKVGGFSLDTPDIDRLHKGGTTTTAGAVNIRPDEELIFLPPAASVVPMTDNVNSMAAAFAGSGSGQQAPIVMQVVLDRKVIAEAVYDHAGDKVARR